MKKTLLNLLAVGAIFTANAQNPFAYGLKGEFNAENNAATLSVDYSLNAVADAVKLQVLKNGEVVAEKSNLAVTKGVHQATIDLTDLLSGTAYYGDYTWQIAVTGGATSGDPTLYTNLSFYHPCGLDVDNSPESPSFGTLFIAEGYTDGKTSGYESAQADGSDGSGLYMYDAAGTNITDTKGNKRFFPSFLTHNHKDIMSGSTAYGADFSKVAVAEDGRIFVSRFNFQGDYILSAESVESLIKGEGFTSLVADKTMTNGIYNDNNGEYLVGPIQTMDVKGKGEDTKIIAICNVQNSAATGLTLFRALEYEIGNNEYLVSANSYTQLDKSFMYAPFRQGNIVYDNRGGVWGCQYQSQADNLVYINANGVKTTIATKTSSYRRGAVAVNPDGTMLAVSGPSSGTFTVYKIDYNADGTVSLTKYASAAPGGSNMYALTWDVSGNLYAGNASSEYVKGYAIPRANNVFATPAASKYGFTIDEATAIDAIAVDANAPVEYYNMQGVKVENPSNGIFIKKQGGRTSKVVL